MGNGKKSTKDDGLSAYEHRQELKRKAQAAKDIQQELHQERAAILRKKRKKENRKYQKKIERAVAEGKDIKKNVNRAARQSKYVKRLQKMSPSMRESVLARKTNFS